MIPQEAINIMYELAEEYMNGYVDQLEFTTDIINGDFPVVVEFEDKYYRGDFLVTILGDEYIPLCIDPRQISIDDYIDFRKQVRPFDFTCLN